MKNKIKEYREKRGLTQEELAEISDVSRTTISGLETGNIGVITNVTMKKISKALETEVNDIFLI